MAGTVFDNFLRNLNYKQSVAMTLGPEALNVMAPSSTSNEPSVKLGELSEGGYSYTSSQFYAVSMMLMFLLYSGLTVCTSLLMKRKSYPFPDKFNASQRLRTVYWQNAWCGCCKYSTVRSDYYSDECAVRCELGNRPGLLLLFCLLMIVASMTLSIVISMFSKTGASARSVVTVLTVSMTFISGEWHHFQNRG